MTARRCESPQHLASRECRKTRAPGVANAGRDRFVASRRWPEFAQARAAPRYLLEWDTEWSLRHMLRVRHSATLEQTITIRSAMKADLHELL
jgi:hypothetical protein